MNRNVPEAIFIFEEQSTSAICATTTAQCAKIPLGFSKARRHVSLQQPGSPNDAVDQEKKDIDEHLASTMKNMSVREREAALEEVNGIVDKDQETAMEDPAVLDRNLIELNEHLQKIKSNSIYETAESMDPDHVQNRKFRLMFLRCKRYDPKGAAEHIIGFFETKEWLFGKEKLCKDITLDDLSEEERVLVQKGLSQGISRDVGGRMVCAYMRGMVKNKDAMNECRAKYYTLMALAESEETQIKGMIALLYVVGDYYKDHTGGSDGMAKLGRVAPTLPIHWAGFHFCCDNTVQYVLIRALVLTMPKHLAAKFRCHKGTHIECVYSMRTYGIPPSALPIPDTGANKPPLMYHHTIWYQNREEIDREKDRMLGMKQHHRIRSRENEQLQEAPTNTANIIPDDDDEESFGEPLAVDSRVPLINDFGFFFMEEGNAEQLQQLPQTQTRMQGAPKGVFLGGQSEEPPLFVAPGWQSQIDATGGFFLNVNNTSITPRRTDVLFGPKHMYHPGTLHLQQMISQQLPVFESIAHRTDKTKFVGTLVQYMKASGNRFLTVDKGSNRWVEVDDKVARNKVAKIFRNKRRTTGLGPSFYENQRAAAK
ncbi:unnamed protein product [Cylindrotheca closterium]|uniref:DUF6824 domain-containing protein n=1 Tax=Cylindrotheca closterium TaxID=2856 RepID=A0AAD2JNN1_9STRA|nr:unnamed protein product [Cylindrotheca closterium]